LTARYLFWRTLGNTLAIGRHQIFGIIAKIME
jgi:hypothetical protein